MWIAVATTAALLVAAGTGLAVRYVADARPYAALPSCRDLLPTDLLDAVPGADRPRAQGDFLPVEDTGYHGAEPDDGYMGSLECMVSDGAGDHVLGVYAALYDAEEGADTVEDRREDIGDGIADLERGRFGEDLLDGDVVADVLAWDALSAGDGGYAVVTELSGAEWADAEVFAEAFFSSANVTVSVSYPQEGRFDEEEIVAFLDGFTGRVDQQLSREGERA
ncbi:hypothetical protein [Nocardiopsis sp. NRRL B-16309]|uniref:hypothetical protein n=1 Tax=Nocardiopsis sp. NRRL B-16309 TaxID=1519494 RepID=UPI0006AEAEB1|nr:hypothetical protein [Nocardiopsis sp. NRRL B-16309]